MAKMNKQVPNYMVEGPRTNAPDGALVAYCACCDAELAWRGAPGEWWMDAHDEGDAPVRVLHSEEVVCRNCGTHHDL